MIKEKISYLFGFVRHIIPESVFKALETANELRRVAMGSLVLLIGILSLIGVWLKKLSSEYVITNKKILYKKGFIEVNVSEISLQNVEGVKVFQSVFDRILGRGTVQVNGVGMEQIEIKGIKAPALFRHNAYTAVETFGSRR